MTSQNVSEVRAHVPLRTLFQYCWQMVLPALVALAGYQTGKILNPDLDRGDSIIMGWIASLCAACFYSAAVTVRWLRRKSRCDEWLRLQRDLAWYMPILLMGIMMALIIFVGADHNQRRGATLGHAVPILLWFYFSYDRARSFLENQRRK